MSDGAGTPRRSADGDRASDDPPTAATDAPGEPAGADASEEPPGADDVRTTAAHFLALLLGHLAVAVLSAAGGVILGGWLAFETGYWRGFKAWIEGLGDGATALAVGLLLLAVVVSVGAASAHAGRS